MCNHPDDRMVKACDYCLVQMSGDRASLRKEVFDLQAKLRTSNLQVERLREALKRVDEILVPLLAYQDERDKAGGRALFSEIHLPREIIAVALNNEVPGKPFPVEGQPNEACGPCGVAHPVAIQELHAFVESEMCNTLSIGEKAKLQRVLDKIDCTEKQKDELGKCPECGEA